MKIMARATVKQEQFIMSLIRAKGLDNQAAAEAVKQFNIEPTMGNASKAIDVLKSLPTPQRPESTVTEAGMYRTPDGDIFKVQKAVHGSGKLYAKRMCPPLHFGDKAVFEYAPGAVYDLDPSMRMTLEEAKAFGTLYGTCCVCGITLTNEKSIDAGIGPVCAKRV